MKKLLKEPLLHFLLIGAALFLIYGSLNNENNESEILIDDNLINELSAKWQLKRNRNPSLSELKGLVDQFIKQEVLYREALAMNLDHNDEIVKRRLAQKMEFLSDGLAESLQPTKEMLQEYFEKHKSDYVKPAVYSMEMAYFENENKAKDALNSKNPQKLGDNISLPSSYTEKDALLISRDYGSRFVEALGSVPLNKWTGPLVSGYGIHLVNISKKEASGYYNFDYVADKVLVNYNYDTSNDFKDELIKTLLKNYSIRFELADGRLKEELNEKF